MTIKAQRICIKPIALFLSLLLTTAFLGVPASAAGETTNDPMVHLVQKWLNQEYKDVPGFGWVAEDGKTGWSTVYGLLRALQHELGISGLANAFGPATSARYERNPLHRQDGVTDRKFAILQGALWCKGYAPGYHLYESADGTVVFDEVFNENVERAVIRLKEDAGLVNPDGTVTLNIMKALMSMDSFKLLGSYGGKAEIRAIQQKLNRKYEAYIGLTPCDGIYGRNTSKALIIALQAEEGLPVGTANGSFGATTKLCCPQIPYVRDTTAARRYPGSSTSAYYTEDQLSSLTALLQSALYVNGFGDGNADGVFGPLTERAVRDFQKQYALPVTGIADKGTWMSLLISSGDKDRPAAACDSSVILTSAKAKTLYDNGYRYVGRYLTRVPGGLDKALSKEEIQIILDAGLRFFPIYQTSANFAAYFTPARATADAAAAIAAAAAFRLPEDTVIYFAVDFDATDSQISGNVLPYFKKVHETMAKSIYKTGIYGSRNVCGRVSELGYTCGSFVADMSTGFSGNLGFSLPADWTFDQFATATIGTGPGRIEIDKNAFSGRDQGVSQLDPVPVSPPPPFPFTDVSPQDWFYNDVVYTFENGLVNGTAATQFSPERTMTRGMIAALLFRMAHEPPLTGFHNPFADIGGGEYFADGVLWAASNKLVNGYPSGHFQPDDNITREQLAAVLYRYADFAGLNLPAAKDSPGFDDEALIHDYARDAVKALVLAGIVGGKPGNLFDPRGNATRAEVAATLHRFLEFV